MKLSIRPDGTSPTGYRYWIDGEGFVVISHSGGVAFNCENIEDWRQIGIENVTVLGDYCGYSATDEILKYWRFSKISRLFIRIIIKIDDFFNWK